MKRVFAVLGATLAGFTLTTLRPGAAWSATSGMQPYTPSNTSHTFSTTSPTYGTATATIQQSSGQSTTGTWTYCASHAVDGSSCPSASHLPAGSVSSWVNQGAATLVTLPNGAQCYAHTNSSGVTWCYAGEPVQDSIGSTGGPFSAAPDTSTSELANQGEAWWGSGGGPNDSAACRGMFDNAPTSSQASFSSCVSQFGTVTWDPSGGSVASIRTVADEMAWRIGAWNGNAWPGGVQCSSRTAIGGTASDSQAPGGLWMQWSSSPARGFWNCTQEDSAAGPPQSEWNASSWYSRNFADWNGFGWYLVYYDYASFVETSTTSNNGVATSISCGGYTSATTVTATPPSSVGVSIDESNGLATFTNQDGTVLSEVSCTNGATPPTTSGSPPPPPPGNPTTTTAPPSPPALLASNYSLDVPVGQSGAVNVLTDNNYRGTPSLSIAANSTQPGTLVTDPTSVDFGYFTWSPTYVDQESAQYRMCDQDGCATGTIYLNSDALPPTSPAPSDSTPTTSCTWYCGQTPPSTSAPPPAPPPSPNITLTVSPDAFPSVNGYVRLVATASNPTSPNYDLRIVYLPDHSVNIDCGHVLSCAGTDTASVPMSKYYVAELVYSDGPPTDYSNEVTVTWGGPTVTLNACLTKTPCDAVTADPAAGDPVFLTARVYNPPSSGSQPLYSLLIVDEATREVVGSCPAGEMSCQVQVTQPGGTKKTYFADLALQNNPGNSYYSNTVDVSWGPSATTTTTEAPTTNPPPTTTVPPTTVPPTTVPPTTAPSTTQPPSPTTTTTPPTGLRPT